MTLNIKDLQQKVSRPGQVEQIWVRPEKFTDPMATQSIKVSRNNGLHGDHYTGGPGSKRQVTLIQHEHLSVIASMVGRESVDARLLRRNIVVSGINLLALKDCVFSIGSAQLKVTGLCHPCSRMEKALGDGGYNAMRGHGGVNATVVEDGEISIGDSVSVVEFG